GSAMQTPPRPERKSPAVTKLKVWPQARNAAGGAPLPDSHDPWRPAKPPTSRPVASRWAARGLPVASCGDARRLCAFPARCPSHGSEDGRLGAAPGGRRGDPLRRGHRQVASAPGVDVQQTTRDCYGSTGSQKLDRYDVNVTTPEGRHNVTYTSE